MRARLKKLLPPTIRQLVRRTVKSLLPPILLPVLRPVVHWIVRGAPAPMIPTEPCGPKLAIETCEPCLDNELASWVTAKTTSAGRVKKILFISDCYLEDPAAWGPFHKSMMALLASACDRVMAIRANSFFEGGTTLAVSPAHQRYVENAVRAFDPDLIFSINRAGGSQWLQEVTRPEVNLLTLFIDYYDRFPETMHCYGPRDRVWVTGSGGLVEHFVRKYRTQLRKDQVAATLWATDTTLFYPQDLPRTTDLIFVGTPFYPYDFSNLVMMLSADEGNRRVFLEAYEDHRQNYVYDWPEALGRHGFKPDQIPGGAGVHFKDNYRLQRYISDQLSGEERLRYLEAVADLDLKIYGSPVNLWVTSLAIRDARLLRRYEFREVSDPLDLARLYNTAKIGLNIQHDHARHQGLSFRAFDLMACKTLLMTHGDGRAALTEAGFVEDQDYVCFDSPAELQSKCRYYLSHEERRQAITQSAHAKILTRHTLPHLLRRVFDQFGYTETSARLERLCPPRLLKSYRGEDVLRNKVRSLDRLPQSVLRAA